MHLHSCGCGGDLGGVLFPFALDRDGGARDDVVVDGGREREAEFAVPGGAVEVLLHRPRRFHQRPPLPRPLPAQTRAQPRCFLPNKKEETKKNRRGRRGKTEPGVLLHFSPPYPKLLQHCTPALTMCIAPQLNLVWEALREPSARHLACPFTHLLRGSRTNRTIGFF